MADRGRGGPRQPARPAAVSNPGSGARTDGGAGSAKQPIRVPSGGAYGQRQAAENQQGAAPMAAGGPSPAPSGTPNAAGGPQAPVAPQAGAFGPTQRPMEDPSAGMGPNQDSIASNPQQALRVLYAKFPHPSIARLLDSSASGGLPE